MYLKLMIEFISFPINLHVISESNVKEHWTKSHKRHKAQKFQVRHALLHYKVSQKLPVKITLTRCSPRGLDSDNLQSAFKYVRDAISEHFIPGKLPGRADDDLRFLWHYNQIKSGDKNIQLSFEWSAPLETQVQDRLHPQSLCKASPDLQ